MTKKRIGIFKNLSLRVIITCLCSAGLQAASAKKPNIIFIITDDHGYNDLEATDLLDEVDMPNIDTLSKGGVLMTQAYCTAPQCVPSRAGIVTGRYQQKFKLEKNGEGPLPRSQKSIASRLKSLGYTTGHVGKWHLDPNRETKAWFTAQGCKSMADAPAAAVNSHRPQGFGYDEYAQGTGVKYWSNFDINGKTFKATSINYRSYDRGTHKKKYRIQLQTELALNFIKRNVDKPNPFFLYLAYYGPHSPLDAPASLTDQVMSLKKLEGKGYENTQKIHNNKNYAKPYTRAEVRQQGLALLKGIDNGVGDILKMLGKEKVLENTLIVFMSDNGAPLGVKSWDGSLNNPWHGSKGIIFEGGSRIPYIVHWKGVIKPQIYDKGVNTLDAGATAVAVAGNDPAKDAKLDGVNLVPFLTGKAEGDPHQYLYQRYMNTSSVVSGKFKFMRHENGEELLFNLSMEKPGAYNPKKDFHEAVDLVKNHPEKAAELRKALKRWTKNLPITNRKDGYINSLHNFIKKQWGFKKGEK